MRGGDGPYNDPDFRAACGGTLRPGGLSLTAEALDLCAFAPGARVLDLACGAGETLKLLRARGLEGLGLEASPELAALAREHGPVLSGDFHGLPLADQSLDGIFCECALSLAERPEAVLAECARVLKSGGRLVISDLVLTRTEAVGGPSGATTVPELSSRVERAGFSVIIQRDHSRALKELAARLLWHYGSAEALRALGNICPGRARGYILLIAAKRPVGPEGVLECSTTLR